MEENVRKELDVLILKVKDWRNSYLRHVTGENDEYLIQDLNEDIGTWMAPYIRRLHEMEFITKTEVDEFWLKIKESFDEFVEDVKAGRGIKIVEKVDTRALLHQFEVHSDFIKMGHGGTEFLLEQKLKLAELAIKLIPALANELCACGGKCKSEELKN